MNLLSRTMIASIGLVIVALASGQSPEVRQAEAHCVILGPTDAVSLKKITQEVNFAYARYSEVFGTVPPPLTIDLRAQKSSPGSGDLYLPWISHTQLKSLMKGQVPDQYLEAAVSGIEDGRPLSHEVGHALLVHYVSDQVKSLSSVQRAKLKSFGEYGSPYLPDWADEAFALMCEQDSLHKGRLAQFSTERAPIPLSKLFTMNHPIPLSTINKGKSPDANSVTVVVSTSSSASTSDYEKQTNLFYCETASLCDYLHAKTGTWTFFKTVVDRLLAQKKPDALFSGLPGLPGSVADLQKSWAEWRVHHSLGRSA